MGSTSVSKQITDEPTAGGVIPGGAVPPGINVSCLHACRSAVTSRMKKNNFLIYFIL
jgi:hypothetical protein